MYSTDFSKKYYKIGDVAALTGLPEATLRYWESKFDIIRPKRNAKGTRYYTPDDIEKVRIVQFLTREKGLHLEAARDHLRNNRDGISRHAAAVVTLRDIRSRVEQLLAALGDPRR